MWHKDWSQRKTIVLFGLGIINNDRMENLGDKKYLIFSYVCLIGKMEKWMDGKKKKLFDWKEKWDDDRKCNLYKFILIKKKLIV